MKNKLRAIAVPGYVALIKQLKEKHPDEDMPPIVQVMCDQRIAAMVVSDQVDRDRGLWVAQILRASFDPDKLVFASEVFGRDDRQPGERWEPGQLQRRAAAGDPDVWEALYILECDRSGAMNWWFLRFEHAGLGLVWTEIQEGSIAAAKPRQDYVPLALRAIMTDADGRARTLAEHAAQLARYMDVDAERALYLQTRGALLYLEQLDCGCFDFRPRPADHDGHRLKNDPQETA